VSDARAEILRRVRAALVDVPAGEDPEDVAVARGYRTRDAESSREEIVDRFCAMVEDYNARVHRVAAPDLADTIGRLCREGRLRQLVVPPALPEQWRPDGIELVEDNDLEVSRLDGMDGVLSGCASAIAQTGTIVLDGGARSGRRAITLVPDHHLCVVEAEQVLALVSEAIARVAGAVRERRAPITLVSGPSATSDIELDRVEGVHGPRVLDIVLVERGATEGRVDVDREVGRTGSSAADAHGALENSCRSRPVPFDVEVREST